MRLGSCAEKLRVISKAIKQFSRKTNITMKGLTRALLTQVKVETSRLFTKEELDKRAFKKSHLF